MKCTPATYPMRMAGETGGAKGLGWGWECGLDMLMPCHMSRSILTVPWLELGGKVNLSCEKTGYAATIDFHCKPFYGGRKHRVTADIL